MRRHLIALLGAMLVLGCAAPADSASDTAFAGVQRRDEITYTVEDLPRGAAARIMATDDASIAAVHEFLAFQRSDHRAAGHEGH